MACGNQSFKGESWDKDFSANLKVWDLVPTDSRIDQLDRASETLRCLLNGESLFRNRVFFVLHCHTIEDRRLEVTADKTDIPGHTTAWRVNYLTKQMSFFIIIFMDIMQRRTLLKPSRLF
jgi:hypothetical protein